MSDELLIGNIRFSTAGSSDSSEAIVNRSARQLPTTLRYDSRSRKVYLSDAADWMVFDLNGVLARKGFGREINLNDLNHGTYLVKAGGSVIKVR